MSTTVYVPGDAAAVAMGADAVARAVGTRAKARRLDVSVVRNGSRGLFWLEPLIEVETRQGRVAYGPVAADAVAGLFDAGFLRGKPHSTCLGLTEEHSVPETPGAADFCPLRPRRSALSFGLHEPRRLPWPRTGLVADTRGDRGRGCNSGLRGRGGAGFPTGIKWRTVLHTAADKKYIVCNADEGDSGTYADRMIMEGDPFVLIEGMTIAGIAVGATSGYIYVRSEYPHAFGRCNVPCRSPGKRAISVRMSRAAAKASISMFGWERARTFAAKRPRCSKAWRASAARSDSSRRSRRSGAVRKADGGEQRYLARHRARSFWIKAPNTIASSAWADPAAL